MVGTATRIISQPAFSRLKIWFIVDFTSSVFVLHMDWMRTGFPHRSPGRQYEQLSYPFCSCFIPLYFKLFYAFHAYASCPSDRKYTSLSTSTSFRKRCTGSIPAVSKNGTFYNSFLTSLNNINTISTSRTIIPTAWIVPSFPGQ